MPRLTDDNFTNDFVCHFPGDKTGNLIPRQTPGVLYSLVHPTPVKAPKLLAWSNALAQQLGITEPSSQQELNVLAGNLVTAHMQPYAACYAGHQFGNWAGQLGDGRAITLGEWISEKGNSWELQLKGAGLTPYSRHADGRAVLRSSVREYLMSEAMHYLGVPTTRALSLVTTGEPVMRDMFYDGHPEYEPGAIVMRAAPSFLRFGNFEMLAARKEMDNLRQLVDWTIEKHFPEIKTKGEERIIEWFKTVTERTAHLMVEWARVGFVHGVMNTDNMSVLGLTIDYGPYSFLDEYDPDFTPNTTDLPGKRYAFGKQPSVAQWNLSCLAGAIAPLLKDTNELVTILNEYADVYWMKYFDMIASKLDIENLTPERTQFIYKLEKMLSAIKPDMTIFYQLLADAVENNDMMNVEHFEAAFYQPLSSNQVELFTDFLQEYQSVIAQNERSKAATAASMRRVNPRFILRNYLLHQAIEKLTEGDESLFVKLQEAIQTPYDNHFPEFFAKRPQWASDKAGCSMLSCSS